MKLYCERKQFDFGGYETEKYEYKNKSLEMLYSCNAYVQKCVAK